MATKALGDDLIPNLKSKIKDLVKSELLNQSYPVGSIYMSATLSTAAQVNAALGGTWQAWGSGQVPVGVNTSDSNFNTVEKTGGSSTHTHTNSSTGAASGNTGATTLTADQMPSHYHNGITLRFQKLNNSPTGTGSGNWLGSGAYHWGSSESYNNTSNDGGYTAYTGGGGSHTHTLNSHTHTMSSTGSSSTLQPYITCYMYKRIS